MSKSKYSKNFLAGDIVAVECKVKSNYVHDSGELSLVPMHGSISAIYVREDSITMIRPILSKGDPVSYDGMLFNVVAQDADLEATWISRSDGAVSVVVQSSELTRMIVGVDLARNDTADAMVYTLTTPLPETAWKDGTRIQTAINEEPGDPDQVEEAPPSAPLADYDKPHYFEGSGNSCEFCDRSRASDIHDMEERAN